MDNLQAGTKKIPVCRKHRIRDQLFFERNNREVVFPCQKYKKRSICYKLSGKKKFFEHIENHGVAISNVCGGTDFFLTEAEFRPAIKFFLLNLLL